MLMLTLMPMLMLMVLGIELPKAKVVPQLERVEPSVRELGLFFLGDPEHFGKLFGFFLGQVALHGLAATGHLNDPIGQCTVELRVLHDAALLNAQLERAHVDELVLAPQNARDRGLRGRLLEVKLVFRPLGQIFLRHDAAAFPVELTD